MGCKVSCSLSSLLTKYSFISTMWDVKCSTKAPYAFDCLRFISTMWDVKSLVGSLKLSVKVFYLDYVGCKDLLLSRT